LVADVRSSADALHTAWDALTPEMWATGGALTRAGVVPASYLPMMRWREVEIHHADLGRGFTWSDWSQAYIRADLPRLLALLVDRDPGQARRLVAALAGRHDGPVTLGAVLV
jgi:maleylpyruvate isomerase